MAVRYENADLHPKTLTPGLSAFTKRAFNASLTLIDTKGDPRPYLAESVPQLNTDSWRVSPDGRMETTYRLRPNLSWHDGTPLSVEDFVFGLRVYKAPGLAAFTSSPQHLIDEVVTPDPRTLVIHWNALYPNASALVTGDLDPLPRHLLEGAFEAFLQDPGAKDVFLGMPVWASQYVGLGPYRLTHWELGSSLEGVAFDGHALGRPKIDRIVVRVIPDENTVMTNLLAGNLDLATDLTLRFEQGQILKAQAGDAVTIQVQGGGRHLIWVQFRPEYQKTPALLDLRVRRALAHAIDRDAVDQVLYDGQGVVNDLLVPKASTYYAEVERAVPRYPFDPARTEQLLNDAGFRKDGAGFFVGPNGDRFSPDYMVDGTPVYEREMNIILDAWRRIGLDVQGRAVSIVLLGSSNEARATWPGLYATSSGGAESRLNIFIGSEVGTPENRWAGGNRGGWSSPDYDRWWAAFNTDLDRKRRDQDVIEMMKVVADQVPVFGLSANAQVQAFTSTLKGPDVPGPESLPLWNIHEWLFS
jgi:peptide/nickel transport system substrate-binding protein